MFLPGYQSVPNPVSYSPQIDEDPRFEKRRNLHAVVIPFFSPSLTLLRQSAGRSLPEPKDPNP